MNDYLITNSLASIAAQMNTPDPEKQRAAVIGLRLFLDTLPKSFVLADESLSLQALALSIGSVLAHRLADDEEGFGLLMTMMEVMRSAANYAECMNGTVLEEHAFFDVGRMSPIN